jgi:hypothetical protein
VAQPRRFKPGRPDATPFQVRAIEFQPLRRRPGEFCCVQNQVRQATRTTAGMPASRHVIRAKNLLRKNNDRRKGASSSVLSNWWRGEFGLG